MKIFPLIDVLRGFSALLVVFYHVLSLRNWPGFDTTGVGRLPMLGWVGVDIFFVISGFVISKTAMDASQSGAPWRKQYAERRLRRILPLYLASMAVYLFMVSPGVLQYGWMSVVHVLSHLGFVHNIWHETHGSINSPSWSVGLEMQFYLLIAFTAPWLVKARIWTIMLLWIGVAWAWKSFSVFMLPPGNSIPIIQFIYASQLPGVLDEFVFGILIAKLLQNGHLNYSPARMLAWAGSAAVVLALSWVTIGDGSNYWNSAETIVFWRTLVCLGFACLLACAVMSPWAGGVLLAPWKYFGKISYGIYLWHMPVLLTIVGTTQWQGLTLLVATMSCTIVMAALSWHGFEKFWLTPSRQVVGQTGLSGRPLTL